MLFCLELPPVWRLRASQPWGHVVSTLLGGVPWSALHTPTLCTSGAGGSGTLPSSHSEWGSQRLEVSHVHKVESVIPWLNDALVFFTVSLQLCQQLKDKVGAPGGRVEAGPHSQTDWAIQAADC